MKCKFCGEKYKAKMGYASCPNCGGAYDTIEANKDAQKVVTTIFDKQAENSSHAFSYISAFLEQNPKIKKIAYAFLIMLAIMVVVQFVGMLVVMWLTL